MKCHVTEGESRPIPFKNRLSVRFGSDDSGTPIIASTVGDTLITVVVVVMPVTILPVTMVTMLSLAFTIPTTIMPVISVTFVPFLVVVLMMLSFAFANPATIMPVISVMFVPFPVMILTRRFDLNNHLRHRAGSGYQC